MPGKLLEIRPVYLVVIYASVGLLSTLMSRVHISSDAVDTAIVFARYLFFAVSVSATFLGIYRGGEFRTFWIFCLVFGVISLPMIGVFNAVYSVFLIFSVGFSYFRFP